MGFCLYVLFCFLFGMLFLKYESILLDAPIYYSQLHRPETMEFGVVMRVYRFCLCLLYLRCDNSTSSFGIGEVRHTIVSWALYCISFCVFL